MIEYAIEDNIKIILVIICVTNEHKTYESTVSHILPVAPNLLGPFPGLLPLISQCAQP
jgi:hypothetical protein